MELARETTPENFLDTRCKDNRCAENASPHFCLLRHYIWYLKSFRGSVRWQPAKRILGGFLFQIFGGEKGRVPKISFSPPHRLFYTTFPNKYYCLQKNRVQHIAYKRKRIFYITMNLTFEKHLPKYLYRGGHVFCPNPKRYFGRCFSTGMIHVI